MFYKLIASFSSIRPYKRARVSNSTIPIVSPTPPQTPSSNRNSCASTDMAISFYTHTHPLLDRPLFIIENQALIHDLFESVSLFLKTPAHFHSIPYDVAECFNHDPSKPLSLMTQFQALFSFSNISKLFIPISCLLYEVPTHHDPLMDYNPAISQSSETGSKLLSDVKALFQRPYATFFLRVSELLYAPNITPECLFSDQIPSYRAFIHHVKLYKTTLKHPFASFCQNPTVDLLFKAAYLSPEGLSASKFTLPESYSFYYSQETLPFILGGYSITHLLAPLRSRFQTPLYITLNEKHPKPIMKSLIYFVNSHKFELRSLDELTPFFRATQDFPLPDSLREGLSLGLKKHMNLAMAKLVLSAKELYPSSLVSFASLYTLYAILIRLGFDPRYVPKRLKTMDMQALIDRKDHGPHHSKGFKRPDFMQASQSKNSKYYLETLKDSHYLSKIPLKNRTTALYQAALSQTVSAERHLPDSLINAAFMASLLPYNPMLLSLFEFSNFEELIDGLGGLPTIMALIDRFQDALDSI